MTEVTRMRRLIVQNANLAMYEEKERLHAVRKWPPFLSRKTKSMAVVFL